MIPSTRVIRTSARVLSNVRNFYLPSKQSNTHDSFGNIIQYTDDLVNNNILGKGNTPQNIRGGEPNMFSGKLITFSGDISTSPKLEVIDSKDTSEFEAILSCGLGGAGTEERLLGSWYPTKMLMNNSKVLTYSSLTEGERRPERFRLGLPYYYDESYINQEESEHFFNEVFKNKFFDADDNLKNPQDIKPLTLIGFSIGHRENKSHINYLQQKLFDALDREGKSSEDIEAYLTKLTLINIASPVHWENRKLPQEILEGLVTGDVTPKEAEEYYAINSSSLTSSLPLVKIRTIHYRSILDMGTAKPTADFNNFHCNSNLYGADIFHFTRPNNEKEDMYVMGVGLVRNSQLDVSGYKNNILGHNLENYAKAIHDNPTTLQPIYSLGFGNLSELEQERIHPVERFYQSDRIPAEEDSSVLKEEWKGELLDRKARKSYSLTKQEEYSR